MGKVTLKSYSAFLFILSVLLAGCASQRSVVAENAKTDLVGMSKKDLLTCAGVPNRQEAIDDLEYLTYTGDESRAGGAVMTSQYTAVHSSRKKSCEATFVLKDGIVQKVSYKGRDKLCAVIVENCVRE